MLRGFKGIHELFYSTESTVFVRSSRMGNGRSIIGVGPVGVSGSVVTGTSGATGAVGVVVAGAGC